MGLAKSYCKEIIRELEKIPVFLPGSPVAVGDVISFGQGLFKSKPIGSFNKVSSLTSLGIDFNVDNDANPDPYLYASKGSVGVSFTADANASTVGNGRLDITFNKEGATYFAAVNCTVNSMSDTSNLEELLKPHRNKVDWKNCYIVTSVTMAGKALIMQSNSKSANLAIEGDVKGLQPGGNTNINTSASVTIKTYKDSSFIKDWSNNVTVFFTLLKYRKRILRDWGVTPSASMLTSSAEDTFELNAIYPEDLMLE